MKGFRLIFVVLTLILFSPFSNAVETELVSPQEGLNVESFDAVQKTVEEKTLPIYVQIDRDANEITIINQNDVPVDISILAMDSEGHKIASWPLTAVPDPNGVTFNLSVIFEGILADQIASIKVVSDEPYVVLNVDTNEKLNGKFMDDQRQIISQENDNNLVQLLSSNPLSVLFKPQVLPGTWSQTKNCGQTSSLMAMCYLNGTTPTEQGIKNIDDWLFSKYNDPINAYNGSFTNTTKLEALAKEYGGFVNSYKASGWSLNTIKSKINEGIPVIAAVTASYLSNRGYSYAGGHFVTVIGYTDTQIICNDPGTSSGNKKYYSNTEFSQAFSASGSSVVVVVPNGNACSDFGEPNGSFSTAYSVSCGSSPINAKICSSTDVDYYKVTPSSSGTMTIKMTPPSDKDYDLYIYNSSQTLICYSALGTGVQDVNSVPVTSGQTYYIKVTGYNSAFSTSSTYSLGVTCSSLSTFPDFVITGITLNPSSPAANSTFSATVTVKNQGTAAGNAGWLDVWSNNTATQTCGAYGDKYVYAGTLNAGASSSFTLSGLPAGAAGSKTLRAFIDSGCATVETYDNNNQLTKTYTVTSATSTPTLLIDGGTSSTKSQGGTFTFTGTGYTSNGTVYRYLKVPGSSSWQPLANVMANSSGNISYTYPSTCSDTTGTYYIYTRDVSKAKDSNQVTEIITASSSCVAPSLKIDGGTSSTKAQGGTFVCTGSSYTPNGSVTRYMKQPNGSTITLTPTIYANSSGNISWSYTSVCTTQTGTYSIWVKDNSTGKTSNTVTEVVTSGSSCNPTLLIDGGTSSSKSRGGTFVCTGSSYTPNGSVTRYMKQPNGSTITLTPTIYANSSGNISWSYTSVSTTPKGTYSIWVKDNSTGKTSNKVSEIVK